MSEVGIANQIISAWQRHNKILIDLITAIPAKGLGAVPLESRGRTVAAQFYHLDRVRRGWTAYHKTGQKPKLDKFDKENPPNKTDLKKLLRESSKEVEDFLKGAVKNGFTPKMFNKEIVRWYTYLVEHESHHRGSILLALKQNNIKLPQKVVMDRIWGRWMFGK